MSIRKAGLAVLAAVALVFGGAGTASAKGKIEFGFHYGSWSLNLLKGTFENLAEDFAKQLKDEQLKKIQDENPDEHIVERSFTNEVTFDSSGHDFGFEIRWYPAGENGSFSLGLAVEKVQMKFGLTSVKTAMSLENALTGERLTFDGDANGNVESNPLAFLLSLRWDIIPSGRVHPYFSLGFGAAGVSAWDKTTLTYDFVGTLRIPGEPPDSISDAATKTLLQLKEEEGEDEEPFEYPIKFFPFVQIHLGLKAKLTSNVHLLVDAGILDGFLLRGGIAIRI
jgi:hypothetical protein